MPVNSTPLEERISHSLTERDRRVAVLLDKKQQEEKDFNRTFNYGRAFGLAILIASAYPVYSFTVKGSIDIRWTIISITISLVYLLYELALFLGHKAMAKLELQEIEYELLKLGNAELKENIEDNFFTKLIQINFKYIDQYYLQTQEQANKSFTLSAFASGIGLLIIIVGIVMMYTGEITPAYVTTAAGIVSEMIAAVFFYLYNRTILKMSQYHQKLVLTQNISLALKISDGMSDENKATAQRLLIDRLTTDVNKHLTS